MIFHTLSKKGDILTKYSKPSFTVATDYFAVKICEYVFIFVYEMEVLFTHIC